jgi:hypothetical protein
MEPNRNRDRIEMLKRRLYRRGEDDFTIKRTSLETESPELKRQWPTEAGEPRGISLSVLKRLLTGALIFFVVALAFAAIMWLRGSNLISESKIRISVQSPTLVRAGDPVDFEILINNRNREDLLDAELVVEYPEGTRSASDLTQELPHERQMIGTIPSGSTATRAARAAFFGDTGTTVAVKIKLEYRIKDANNIFEKEVTREFSLSAPPVSLAVSGPAELNPEQELDLLVTVKSNVATDLDRVILVGSYPPGFQLMSASPAASDKKSVWELGKLKAGETREIKIHGAMIGQTDESKTFRFNIGIANPDKPSSIGVPYSEALATIAIKSPFINAIFTLDGKSGEDIVVAAERNLKGDISWQNYLPDRVIDGQVVLKINGRILDRSAVTVDGGFYRSSDNTITWDKSTWRDFASIAPGAEGNLIFGLSSLPLIDATGQPIKNPELNLTLTFKGTRVAEGFPNEPIESVITKRVKIESTFQLIARALYGSGPLENSGPMPPKVDAKTAYTVEWSVTNTSNIVGSSVVRATLPTYVEWAGVSTPASERITYNERTREVSWDIGSVPPGTGTGLPAKQVAFQIILTPSLSQLGSTVPLTSAATLSGIDTFTRTTITDTERALDTRLSTDPTFRVGDELISQ